MRHLFAFLICAAISFPANGGTGRIAGDVSDVLHVERVIDGDTYLLSNGETVRLIGVDTPESYATYKLARDARESDRDASVIQTLGALATRFAESLVLDQPIVLTYDPANAASSNRDRFGRLLAYVNIATETGVPLYCVNDRLIYAGFASAYVKYPFGRSEWYQRAERDAREHRRGLWADDVFEGPVVKRLLATVDDLFVTRTGKRFHRANCPALRYSKIPYNAAEDPDHHYEACRICKPHDGTEKRTSSRPQH
ncbi:MAG: thermonuclease family protein [Rhodothermales bacterium]